MKKTTFLNQNHPLNTCMILKSTPDEIIFDMKSAIYDGADALGIQLERIKREYRTEDVYKRIFSYAWGRPVYITSYRYCESEGLTDDECMENLLMGLSCGATIGDLPGNIFDKPAPNELTYSKEAIGKQIELIDKIHDMGKEVMMSSHIQKFMPAEDVLEIALAQESRGIDVVKIVTAGNSDEEQIENLRITALLKKELKIPFLYLSGGTHCRIHRMVGPMFGCVTYLSELTKDADLNSSKPTVKAVKNILDNFQYYPELYV